MALVINYREGGEGATKRETVLPFQDMVKPYAPPPPPPHLLKIGNVLGPSTSIWVKLPQKKLPQNFVCPHPPFSMATTFSDPPPFFVGVILLISPPPPVLYPPPPPPPASPYLVTSP